MATLTQGKVGTATPANEDYSEVYRLLAAPRRRRILVLYLTWAKKGAPEATPTMIATDLRESLPVVARDIRRLAGVDLLTLTQVERVRGGASHWYSAASKAYKFAPLLAAEIKAANGDGGED